MNKKTDKPQTPLEKPSGLSLLPFLVFIGVYLGVGIVLHLQDTPMAFYQFPAPVAVVIAIVFAFVTFKGTVSEKFSTFSKGVGDENLVTMCMIFLLSGAFTRLAQTMGAVDAVVNLGLTVVPAQFFMAGIFIVACFMSISTGTSMGTIAAVAPLAIGVAEATGLHFPLMLATVIGGAMFGDNLSIISDTTIAATKLQGCALKDKFRCNFWMAFPAALITMILLLIFGRPTTPLSPEVGDANIVLILPYLFVLILSMVGINVFSVLTGGIVLAAIIGMLFGDMTFVTVGQEIQAGFMSMMGVFLTSIFIAGLSAMITKAGGLVWLISKIRRGIRGKKSAELGISAMISLADMAIANNTVAIIVTGPVAREISEEYKVDPRRSAALLDTWSCVWQGALPWGAQILLAVGLSGGMVSAFEIIPLLWYQILLGVLAIASIWLPFADGVVRKNPWDFDKWEAKN